MNYNISNESHIPLLPSNESLRPSESLELPPILDANLSQVPNQARFSNDITFIAPAFLEPTPLTQNCHMDSKFSPKFSTLPKESTQVPLPTLVPSSSSSCSSVSSNSPSPIMRSRSLNSDNTLSIINSDINHLYTPITRCTTSTKFHPLVSIQSKSICQNDTKYLPTLWNNQNDCIETEEGCSPVSPIMSAASAAAAVESVKDNSSSELFLNGFDQKALKRIIPNERSYSVMNDRHYRWGTDMGQHTYSSTHFSSQESKPFLVTPNQSMFLTKNAHIKRPRNAWIRFRCHYGQALKSQDPTLRAEEISKRASRRWSNLSEMEKKPWHDLAEQEKQAHKEAFPNYRYCPRRSNTTTFAVDVNHQPIKTIPLYSKFGLDDEESMNKNKKRRL